MLGSRTDLHIFDAGSVNGTRYCNEILLPYVRLFRGAMGLQFLFMDDNSLCHRTVAAEQLLESENIERMDWPARSPDLNPIEHVWDFLDRRLAARTLPPVTIRELRLALQDEWVAMPQQLIDTLILSMGRRCETCLAIEAKVCGNDGVTYQNECELRVAACTKQLYISVASRGPCDLCINVHCKYGARCEDGRCVCPTECPENYDPVCSSDGTTYRNECEMRRAACEQTMELNVLIYGECEDVGGSGAGIKSPESGSGNSPCDKDACRYGGICDYDSEDRLLCVCAFECPPIRAPVCGSDGEFYDSDCKMKEQSCKTQKKIVIVPKNKCQKVEEIACDGEKPLINPVTGKDYFCGDGPDSKNCPPSSYCHKTLEFAKCCKEVIMIKSCADTIHGCCPDGKTTAQGPDQAGCPSQCNCNRLGSYSSTCDPVTMQCPCKPGVGDLRCDRCEPGFWGLHKISEGSSGCSPCDCDQYGSVRDDCEQMTGRCVCKHGIQGMKCNICPAGTVLGPDGCMDATLFSFLQRMGERNMVLGGRLRVAVTLPRASQTCSIGLSQSIRRVSSLSGTTSAPFLATRINSSTSRRLMWPQKLWMLKIDWTLSPFKINAGIHTP
ncbi:hypothetical protein TNCV_4333161 [Trichonephila clavipes]|nr:hypothetical protein TNCV_4333161 [Trichonephila clavipes]